MSTKCRSLRHTFTSTFSLSACSSRGSYQPRRHDSGKQPPAASPQRS